MMISSATLHTLLDAEFHSISSSFKQYSKDSRLVSLSASFLGVCAILIMKSTFVTMAEKRTRGSELVFVLLIDDIYLLILVIFLFVLRVIHDIISYQDNYLAFRKLRDISTNFKTCSK